MQPDRWRRLWRVMTRWDGLQVRLLGTSGIALMRRTPVLVLETTGRKTGRRRRSPVAYHRRPDGSWLIGGGAAGMSRVDWVANLRANREAAIWVRRRRIPVVAEHLQGEAEEAARAEAFRIWPDVPKYEQISGRRVPYFRLTELTTRSGGGTTSGG